MISCPSCGAHARSGEAACPFCGARVPLTVVATAAALLLGLSACDLDTTGKTTRHTTEVDYGAGHTTTIGDKDDTGEVTGDHTGQPTTTGDSGDSGGSGR